MTPIVGGLLVFLMRVTDMSLETLRMLLVVRGRKLLSGGIGVLQAAVFILAVSAVLKGPLTLPNVLGYALGFGTGVVLGMFAEERLALGYVSFSVYSALHGAEIAAALRAAGFGATEIMASGRDGFLTVVNIAAPRRQQAQVRAVIDGVDPNAFVTIGLVQSLQHGYFRR